MIFNCKGLYLEVTGDEELTIYVPSDPNRTDLQEVLSPEADHFIFNSQMKGFEEVEIASNKSLPPGDEELEKVLYGTPISVVGYTYAKAFKGGFSEPPRGASFEEYGFYITTDPERTDIGSVLSPEIKEDLIESLLEYKENNAHSWMEDDR